ncbi:MAG: FAD-binding oxidoreductase [Pseudomonadota bacterium]
MASMSEKISACLADGGDMLLGDDATSRSAGVWRDDSVQATIIVRPRSTQEVSEVLRVCHEEGQSVVTHGGLTGLVNSADTTAADVVLSMERMNNIIDIDTLGRTMTVQAGVPLQQIHDVCAEHGLMFPVDLGARGSCQIGGNAATNAGGLRVIRYGMTRDNILGIEAVLADGTILSSLNQVLKNNAGYDLKQLFIGSEGTLGVVTQLVLRLRTELPAEHTALVGFSDYQRVLKFLSYFDGALAGNLSAFEVMWPDFFMHQRAKCEVKGLEIDGDARFFAIVESLGVDHSQEAETFGAALEGAMEEGLITDAVVAQSDNDRAAIWKIRDEVEHLFDGGEHMFFDVSLAIRSMNEYVDEVRANLAKQSFDSQFYSFGHLGDGNLHFCVVCKSDLAKYQPTIEECVYQPLEPLGGSISAEHGIGLQKKAYLSLTRSDAEIAVMRTLKHAMDPKGILNPGKIFDFEGPVSIQ